MTRSSRVLAASVGAALVASGALLGASTGSAAPTGTRCAMPEFGAATPNQRLTQRFADYGNDTGTADRRWSGADSTYSVRLPDGRMLWLFSDTFLTPVNADGTRPPDAPFVHNSFVVQDGDTLRTRYGVNEAGEPDAVLRPPGADPRTDWYWVGGAEVTGRTLTVLYHRWHLPPGSDDPLADLKWRENVFAEYSLPGLRLLGTHHAPSALPDVHRGSWLRAEGGYLYVYAVHDAGDTKSLMLARVRGKDLRGRWEFRTAHGWSTDERKSAPLLSGVANEYSVTRHGGTYLLVTHDTGTPLGNEIVAYTSCSPDGPFTGKSVLYRTPEGPYGSPYCGPGDARCTNKVFSYNAHVHPELSTDGRLTLSYNVNSLDTTTPAQDNDNYRDVTIYRPRFVDVPVHFGRRGNTG